MLHHRYGFHLRVAAYTTTSTPSTTALRSTRRRMAPMRERAVAQVHEALTREERRRRAEELSGTTHTATARARA